MSILKASILIWAHWFLSLSQAISAITNLVYVSLRDNFTIVMMYVSQLNSQQPNIVTENQMLKFSRHENTNITDESNISWLAIPEANLISAYDLRMKTC